MGLTVASLSPDPGLGSHGANRVVVKDITFDNDYPTGGEALTAASVGLTKICFGICNILTPDADAVSVVVLPQTDGSALLKANTASAQVAANTDLAALSVRVILWGDA